MSSEVKDPAIKLFGKTICLLRDDGFSCSIAADQSAKRSRGSSITSTSQHNKDENTSREVCAESKEEEDECTNNLSGEESMGSHYVKKDDESSSEHSQTEKSILKKPEKILSCPRCNSMQTKFCYYNNYNINQPRHFCKNCQRYWTAGGSMRNVPVGSGRRKNKTTPSAPPNYHPQITTSEQNGTVFTFGGPVSLYGVLGPWNARWISPDQSIQTANQSSLRNVVIPKFDDPNAAAKSSIWSTLGIKTEKVDSAVAGAAANSLVLQANPAARSRSLNFHERT